MNAKFVIERTNQDPRETTWQWTLTVAGKPVACSWGTYTTRRGAARGAMRMRDAIKVGHVDYPNVEDK